MDKDTFFVKLNNHIYRVELKDIKWIQSDGNYCTIFTDDKKLVVKMSLVKLLEEFSAGNFFQVHKRYIINLNEIDNINVLNSQVFINGTAIPIGRKYKPLLLKELNLLQ